VKDLENLVDIPEVISVHESSDIGVHTIMANAYYDLNTNTAFTPFVGASFGLAVLHLKIKSIAIEDYYAEHTNMHAADVQLAWGLNAGVSYALNNDWSLSLAYRYTDASLKSLTSDIFEVGLEADIKMHDVLFGVRYAF
ncbi:MAG: outer membrane beta-barrel protein, partial [Deltaproteobacteria bacterium]|nr:outer membrane beta-barrel protein [Deltaproteobacteria bacterium]